MPGNRHLRVQAEDGPAHRSKETESTLWKRWSVDEFDTQDASHDINPCTVTTTNLLQPDVNKAAAHQNVRLVHAAIPVDEKQMAARSPQLTTDEKGGQSNASRLDESMRGEGSGGVSHEEVVLLDLKVHR